MIKADIEDEDRPPFTGDAKKMKCGSGKSRDHLVSWEAIRAGYYAALNPSSNGTCKGNLRLLYDAVALDRDDDAIKAACSNKNLSTNKVTPIDQQVLSDLNSSIDNLRCGWSSANQSVGGALDIPCGDQRYNSTDDRIEITGDTADRLASYLLIQSDDERPPYFYKTDQSCSNGLNGGCNDKRIQTSDCKNDVGAQDMDELMIPVYYQTSWSSTWKKA